MDKNSLVIFWEMEKRFVLDKMGLNYDMKIEMTKKEEDIYNSNSKQKISAERKDSRNVIDEVRHFI